MNEPGLSKLQDRAGSTVIGGLGPFYARAPVLLCLQRTAHLGKMGRVVSRTGVWKLEIVIRFYFCDRAMS